MPVKRPEILREYRKALNKLVNSLSWGSTITNPQPIDPQATIFYIDLRHYEWDVNDGWTKIEAEAYPYHIAFDATTDSTAESTGAVADTDEDRYTVGSYRLVYCNSLDAATLPRTTVAAVDGQGFGNPTGGRCRPQYNECSRGSRLAGRVQQFGCLYEQPSGGTAYLTLWGVLEELRLCRQCGGTEHSSPTRSTSRMTAEKLSSTYPMACRATTLSMPPDSDWMMRRLTSFPIPLPATRRYATESPVSAATPKA